MTIRLPRARAGLEQRDFGTLARTLRESLQMSQRRFAAEIGFCPSFISEIETGKRFPHPDFCAELARLDATFDWHLAGARAQGWKLE